MSHALARDTDRYAGGASTIADLERVRVLGNGRVDLTIGSALDLFGGSLPYADVVAWHRRQQEQAPRATAAHWQVAAALASVAVAVALFRVFGRRH